MWCPRSPSNLLPPRDNWAAPCASALIRIMSVPPRRVVTKRGPRSFGRSTRHPASERVRPEHAELIALRIGEHDPRLLTLSHVRSRRAECKQPLDLGVSVIWPEVEGQAILDRLRLRAV